MDTAADCSRSSLCCAGAGWEVGVDELSLFFC